MGLRENNSWLDNEIKEITFYVIFGIIMTVILPIYLGFVLRGFEESFIAGRPLQFGDILVTYMIYYVMIFAGLIGLPILKIREMFVTKKGEHVARQSNPSIFSVAYLHDPEIDGGLYNMFRALGQKGKKNWMYWSRSVLRVFIIATLIFSLIGLLQTINPTAQFVGIPQLPFQVTETMEVLFTAEPPAFAETTMMLFILSLLMGVNAWFVSKFKLPVGVFWVIAFLVICPIIGMGWLGFHNIVYPDSDTARMATFVFGWMGSTLTIAFGTWIFWYEWHFWNNVFAKLSELVPANEDIIFITVVAWVILLIIWITGELILKRVKRGKEPKVVEPSS